MSKRIVPAMRVGHHQRRRGQEGLFGVGMDTAVEVAVPGQDGGRIEVALDDLAAG
jgi:hypothetical protein